MLLSNLFHSTCRILLQVKVGHEDFRLQIDLSTMALAMLSTTATEFHFTSASSASLIFPLIQSRGQIPIPEGTFPCKLFLGQQAVPPSGVLGDSHSQLHPRSEAVFNASDSVAAPPVAMPSEAQTLWLQVQRPIVSLMPDDATENARGEVGLRLEWKVKEGGVAEPQAVQVLVQVLCKGAAVAWGDSGSTNDSNMTLLLGAAVDVPPIAAEDLGLPITDIEVDGMDIAAPIRLAPPDPACAQPALTRVLLPGGMSAESSRLLMLAADEGLPADNLSQGLVVLLAGATGASVAADARWAQVSASSGAVVASRALPEFEVKPAPLHVHRGQKGRLTIVRRGSLSPSQSRVGWRIQAEPWPAEARGEWENRWTLGERGYEGYNALRPPGNLSAALGKSVQGVALWPAESESESIDVELLVQWAEVPYEMRLAVTMHLSGLENARVSTGAPAAADVASGDLPAGTHLVIVGNSPHACDPGSSRLHGPPVAVPLLESATAAADAVGSVEGFFVVADSPSGRSYAPPLPPYQRHRLAYELAVPHDAASTELVILAHYNFHVRLRGCSAPLHGAVLTWTKGSSNMPGVGPDTLMAVWKLPLEQPGDSCLAQVLVCPTAEVCQEGEDSTESFDVTLGRRFDPALAEISSVHITVEDHSAVRICGSGGNVPTCLDQGAPLLANLTYHRGDHIRFDVEAKAPPGNQSRLAIGQRIFHVAGAQRVTASTVIELYDEAAHLSPFVPFFVRSRSSSAVVLDVPMSLTLADSQTSRLLMLSLHIHVMPAVVHHSGPTAPPAHTRLQQAVPAPAAAEPVSLVESGSQWRDGAEVARPDPALVPPALTSELSAERRDSFSEAPAPAGAQTGSPGTEPLLEHESGPEAMRRSVLAAAHVDSMPQPPGGLHDTTRHPSGVGELREAWAAERWQGDREAVSASEGLHQVIGQDHQGAVEKRNYQSTGKLRLDMSGLSYALQAVRSTAKANHSKVRRAFSEPVPLVPLLVPHRMLLADDDNETCTACPMGSFSYTVDVSPCLPCPPGSSAATIGLADCVRCPAGSYSAVYGAANCLPCVHGSFAAHKASSACQLCPLGFTTSSDGAIVCDKRIEQTMQVCCILLRFCLS
jgi:hypothetical protein